ncbi:MAG: lipopolysaccharide biosynthesis protein [Candidatus Acidiferrales bacterium]
MKDLKQRAIRGGLAKVCAQGTSFLIRMGSLMILARLLDPKDFGLVGMVTAVIGLLNLFRDFGLSTAAVQRVAVTEEQASTLFWVNILVGAVLCLLSVAMAPFLARFYHEPRLVWVTIALSLGFIFNAAGVQHSSRLEREMHFTSLSVIDIISQSASTAVGITMALRGYGYWALVGMTMLSPIVYTACLWFTTKWMPGRPRRGVGIGSMLRFGGTVTLNGLVVYVAYNLEKILLGRYWGAETVGIYGRAYQLSTIPTDNLNSSVGGVAFSALSRLQHDPSRIRTSFLKIYSLILALTLPITIVFAIFANDAVAVVLGPKWKEAVPILRLLAPTIVCFAMINPFSWLLFALGRVDRSLKIALVIAPLVISGYLIGLPFGPKGVALGYSAAMSLWVLPNIVWCVHGTAISVKDILLVIRRPLLAGCVAGAFCLAMQLSFGGLLHALARLVLGVAAFGVVYLGMLLYGLGQKDFYLDVIRGLRGRSSVEDNIPVTV